MLIRQYTDRLNRVNATCWEIKEVIEFLLKDDEEACFSDYARKFIDRMEADGHERNAKNYRLAVNHLERFMGTTRLLFSNLSSSAINLWIESLSKQTEPKKCTLHVYDKFSKSYSRAK